MLSFKEFISEGAFGYNDSIKHGFSYTKSFIEKIENGDPITISKTNEKVTIRLDSNVLKLKSAIESGEDVITLLKSKPFVFTSTDGRTFRWVQFEKTDFSGVKSKFNRGDLAEGIVAAAITAKFLNPDKNIILQDVFKVLREMGQSRKDEFIWPKPSEKGSADQIVLKITLKPNSAKALFDEGNWSFLNDEFNGAIKYANSKNVSRYAELIDKNNTNDKVIISSEGAVDEKLTKVDLAVFIGLDGRKPRLTNLNLSLKAGKTKNLEQAGITFDKIEKTFSKFGIDISGMNQPFQKIEEWYESAFRYAVLYLNKNLGNDRAEANVIRNIAKGIKETATRSDDSVVQVQIHGGEFKIYSFKKLEERLSNYKLEAYYNTSSSRPTFGIRDSKTKEDLITFRIEVRQGNVIYKLHVEKGPLLTAIAEK